MTDMKDVTDRNSTRPVSDGPSRFERRRLVAPLAAVAALLLSVTAVGVAGSAMGFPGGPDDPEAVAERAAFLAFRLGRAVEATPEQQARIEELLAAGFDDMAALRPDHRALHEQAVAVLSAPEVDRAALEQLRLEQLAAMEVASQRLVTLVADVAEVLTPEQRAGLADFAEELHRFGRRHRR